MEQSLLMRSTSVSQEIRLVALDTVYSVHQCDCGIRKERSIRGRGRDRRKDEKESERGGEGGKEREERERN